MMRFKNTKLFRFSRIRKLKKIYKKHIFLQNTSSTKQEMIYKKHILKPLPQQNQSLAASTSSPSSQPCSAQPPNNK